MWSYDLLRDSWLELHLCRALILETLITVLFSACSLAIFTFLILQLCHHRCIISRRTKQAITCATAASDYIIRLGMGPQELLHRCVLVVLKLTNRNERWFCLFVHCGFSCLVSSSCQCLQQSVSSSTVAERLSKEDDCIAVHLWYPRQWNLVCRWCYLLLFDGSLPTSLWDQRQKIVSSFFITWLQTTFVCRDTKEWCVFLDLVFTYRYTYIHTFYLYPWNPPIYIYVYL